MRYHDKHVRAGRKLALKLWNAARFAAMHLEDFDPTAPRAPYDERPIEDRWMLSSLDALIPTVRQGFETHDYALGRDAIDRFFWATFCDDWLEIAKDRLQHPERYPSGSRSAAQASLFEGLRTLLGLLAPYVPFMTEAVWQRLYASSETAPSIHVTRFPAGRGLAPVDIEPVLAVLRATRALRTELRISQSAPLAEVVIDGDGLEPLEASLRAAARAERLRWGPASHDAGSLRADITP